MQVWKTTGKKPQALEAPPPPEELFYVWELYDQLFTGQSLTFNEISGWCELMGIHLEGWEAQLIRDIDRDFWRVKHGGYRKP